MKTFGLNYDVKPDRIDDFKDYALGVLAAMDGFEGHEETRLYIDAQKPHSMMIYSRWDTVENFGKFMRSAEFKGVKGDTRDMLMGRPSHKVYEQTNDLDRMRG